MIRQVYRLTGERQFEICHVDTNIEKLVLVRPSYLSICAADQRYYLGNRDPDVMNKKLPMALLHEACGVVLEDYTKKFSKGDTVVIVPNIPNPTDTRVRENYQEGSKFRSSGCDGFMQSIIPISSERLVKINSKNLRHSVMCELLSVAICGIKKFLKYANIYDNDIIGIWGDGNVGFATALALKVYFKNVNIVIYGKNMAKLQYFSFANTNYSGKVHHAFECVGGEKTESVLDEIIDCIYPQGIINLLGVSENKIPLNTRMVLEKGLSLFGHSRSSKEDFEDAAKLIDNNEYIKRHFESIISQEIEINNISDIHRAFEHDIYNDFKTILKWNI